MKYFIAFTLLGGTYFLYPYLLVAFQIFFFDWIIDTAIAPIQKSHCYWKSFKKEIRMSDVANDIYPLSVEEYESAEVIAEDVEVE